MTAHKNALLDYYQALDRLLHELPSRQETETRTLTDAAGLVLADDIFVLRDVPPFDNSAMDGYALGGNLENRKSWTIVQRIAAGDSLSETALQTGEAARIFTGAPVPQGTSTILLQEEACIAPDGITLSATLPVQADQHIRRQGEEYRAGDCLIRAHERLTPAHIALLASQGYETVRVFKPLTICIFSTGNELVPPGVDLKSGQIYDANRFLLLSWLKDSIFTVHDGDILPDSESTVEAALSEACKHADVILTSGGVSVGEEDYLKQALIRLGKLNFWKLAIKPGKPFTWGEIGHCTVFMLPGNPVSSLVTFQQLVVPALRVLMGEKPEAAQPQTFAARAAFSRKQKQKRREFIRVVLNMDEGVLYALPMPQQGSAMLSSCTGAQALAEIPPLTAIEDNDLIRIYPLTYKV